MTPESLFGEILADAAFQCTSFFLLSLSRFNNATKTYCSMHARMFFLLQAIGSRMTRLILDNTLALD